MNQNPFLQLNFSWQAKASKAFNVLILMLLVVCCLMLVLCSLWTSRITKEVFEQIFTQTIQQTSLNTHQIINKYIICRRPESRRWLHGRKHKQLSWVDMNFGQLSFIYHVTRIDVDNCIRWKLLYKIFVTFPVHFELDLWNAAQYCMNYDYSSLTLPFALALRLRLRILFSVHTCFLFWLSAFCIRQFHEAWRGFYIHVFISKVYPT